jgi:hypothetical protein
MWNMADLSYQEKALKAYRKWGEEIYREADCLALFGVPCKDVDALVKRKAKEWGYLEVFSKIILQIKHVRITDFKIIIGGIR